MNKREKTPFIVKLKGMKFGKKKEVKTIVSRFKYLHKVFEDTYKLGSTFPEFMELMFSTVECLGRKENIVVLRLIAIGEHKRQPMGSEKYKYDYTR